MTLARKLATWSLGVLAAGVALLAVVVLGFAILARSKHPGLEAWHRIELREEFHAGRTDVTTFDAYLRLEDRLFSELRARLLDDPAAGDRFVLGRYHPGAPPAVRAWQTPYNRSFELRSEHPRGAVLLVHGLTDSPYSLRAAAEAFHASGYDVVALRLPGHGTTPSMLRHVTWKDWYAAVDLAARHAASRAGPGRPFVAVGHSTGSALLTLHALRALDDPTLPRPERLYLFSPAIGVSDFAFMTNVISGLSFIPPFEKSAWLEVMPEYDPYKYNSFPVNAAKEIYRVTRELREGFVRAGGKGRLASMPRVTVFHSLMDATVNTEDVVRNLLALLPGEGNELVVFDVNRHERLAGLLAQVPIDYLERIRNAAPMPFRVTLVTNRDPGTVELAAYSRAAGSRDVTVVALPLAWPPGVFSLSHVAVPFPPDDPVYGLAPAEDGLPPFPLGAVAARGENGALRVPAAVLLRLRANPFFEVVRRTIDETCRRDEEAVRP